MLLHLARTYGQRFFLEFGLHCANHQTRIILVSCVVITSLFYPALALYGSQTKSISIFDALISPNSSVHVQHDLADLWSGHDSLGATDDAVSRARCGTGRTVRVERLLVQSSFSGDSSALNHGILLSTLNFERRLEELVPPSSCIQTSGGKCFVLSPLSFWGHDREALSADSNILDRLGSSKSILADGIPITPEMVLAGRSVEPTLDFADFLALTYFFPQSVCFSASERTSWQEAVKAAAGQEAELRSSTQEPTIVALQFGTSKGRSAISVFLYLSYASFFAYVFWSMRQMKSVHSRVGIAFTALVEIVVSTITSLSVCALVGFRVTMVPWELLPIVIVFVGAENMFNLVDAVGRTSVTLTVKRRIAEGLSRAGTSNTLKVVSYNAILGVIAVVAVGSIRQFCVFAIVVLVAHWFLAHTFFMAVLSIDMQRLELEELLRQDSGLAPPLSSTVEKVPAKSTSTWRNSVLLARKMLSGRATKNLSLVLLLTITATLYYATMPSNPSADISTPTQAAPRGALFRHSETAAASPIEDMTVDSRIWKLLNPNDAPLHLQVEAPTFLTFRPNAENIDHHHSAEARSHRSLLRTLRLISWLLKIMVLPIAATTFLLWLLCLYLLKDSELLDSQQNRPGPESSPLPKEDPSALEQHVSFSTLPRAFSSDVELIATSSDGRVAVSAGLHNEVIIWRTDSCHYVSIDTSELFSQSSSSSSSTPSTLTSVAMDDNGHYCAVSASTGVIGVWDIRNDSIHSLPHLSLPDTSAAVATEMRFMPNSPQVATSSPPTSNPTSPVLAPLQSVHLVAVYENGTVAKYTIRGFAGPTYIRPARSTIVQPKLILVRPENKLIVAFSLRDGRLELLDAGDTNAFIPDNFCVQAGNLLDPVTAVDVCCATLGGEKRVIIAAASGAGVVSLWDAKTGDCIRILEDAYGRINQLRVSFVIAENCRSCGQPPSGALLLTFSVDHVVRFFKQFVSDGARRCSCTSALLKNSTRDNGLGYRSRTSSISSSIGSASPKMSRTRKFSESDVSPFPVSGHGIHSRRVSEKESNRRPSDVLLLQIDSEDGEMQKNAGRGPRDIPRYSSVKWQDSYIVHMGDTTCDRGGWDIYEGKVVGVRRKPRSAPSSLNKGANSSSILKDLSAQGLSITTLDRWEIWSFDPSATLLQSSSLSSIMVINNDYESQIPLSPSSSSSSSLPPSLRRSHVPRIPFTRVTPFIVTRSRSLAGFGNTLGVFNFFKF